MKLKTIKDYECTHTCECNCCDAIPKLRQEGIKHAKSCIAKIEAHSHAPYDESKTYLDCIRCRNHYVRLQWIKYYFSIKDAELK